MAGTPASLKQFRHGSAVLLASFVVVLLAAQPASARVFTVGGLIEWTGWGIAKQVGSSLTIAVEKVNADPALIPGHTMDLVWEDSGCDEGKALESIFKLHDENPNLAVVIGPGCSAATKTTNLLANLWSVVQLSYASVDTALSSKARYPTFARTVAVWPGLGPMFIEIARTYGWNRIGVAASETGIYQGAAASIKDQMVEAGLDVPFFRIFPDGEFVWDAAANEGAGGWQKPHQKKTLIADFKKEARIMLLFAKFPDVRDIMIEAARQGLSQTGEYFFMSPTRTVTERLSAVTHNGVDDGEDSLAFEGYQGMLTSEVRAPPTQEYADFLVDVAARMSDPPFSTPMGPDDVVNAYAGPMHDAVLLYAHALTAALDQGVDPADGHAVSVILRATEFEGIGGRVVLDENGDRKMDYTLYNYQTAGADAATAFQPVGEWLDQTLTFSGTPAMVFGGGATVAPSDAPKCGFDGSLCVPAAGSDGLEAWVVAVIAVGALLLVGGLVAFLFVRWSRQQQLERELADRWWDIKWEELVFSASNAQSKSRQSFLSAKSARTKSDVSSLLTGSRGPGGEEGTFIVAASFRDRQVAVKKLPHLAAAGGVEVTREFLQQLKALRDVQGNNGNLHAVVGVCLGGGDQLCVLSEYCTRGSLQDVLLNDTSYNLDWMFKFSLARDVAEGMRYLHTQAGIAHGDLRSSTCLVDSRWVCKVARFGLDLWARNAAAAGPDTADSHAAWSKRLWRAPELLSGAGAGAGAVPAGTMAGDMWSYAVILVEVVERDLPYAGQMAEPKELVGKVRAGQLRPAFAQDSEAAVPEPLRKFQVRAAAADPAARPRFVEAVAVIKQVNPSSGNMMDNLTKMLEQYASNLEGLVAERTMELEGEKAKVDRLLFRMLPESVANVLKQGLAVEAETFGECTIFFSDIVGFTNIAGGSTPMQVVDLLNDLYTCFDDIIDEHDVYKVETIGDAYMVVSGIPDRNGNRHAGEISNLALDLLSSTTTFKIRHQPETQLQLRIGLHSGPAVAGVVGLKMPRYCLFGDTVNTASRMESSGYALRIHLSSFTKAILDAIGGYDTDRRGEISVKGKGQMETHWLLGREGFQKPMPDLARAASHDAHEFK